MARNVDEIMNRELLTVRTDTPTRDVRDLIRSFEVGCVPVVDDEGRPLGVLSLRDVLDVDATAGARMSKPAMCVEISSAIGDAAHQLARSGRNHLVVVDGSGAAVGMLSTLDALRGVLGLPTPHPATFPHWDEETHVSWTDDLPLDEMGSKKAPDGPGFLLVVSGAPGERDAVVWSEPCANVRARVVEMVLRAPKELSTLARELSRPGVRFRAAAVFDKTAQQRIAALLRDRLEHRPPPGAT
jgi:CBS domain-containing protein